MIRGKKRRMSKINFRRFLTRKLWKKKVTHNLIGSKEKLEIDGKVRQNLANAVWS